MKTPLFKSWLLGCVLGLIGCASGTVDLKQLEAGKQLAFTRSKGNCLACHVIADGEAPGNLGQPLHGLAKLYDDKPALRAMIWDATRFNPETSMPPFGHNKILTNTEIDQIVDYLWSLE